MSHRHASLDADGWAPGLVANDHGLAGVTFEPTDAFNAAVARFQRAIDAVDDLSRADTAVDRGGKYLLRLATDCLVLHLPSLQEAVGPRSACYRAGSDAFVEWSDAYGWCDRRSLSLAACEALGEGGELHVGAVGWRWFRGFLRDVCVEYSGVNGLRNFLADGSAWWWRFVTPAQLAHATGFRRRHLMSRDFLARRETGLAQLPAPGAGDGGELDDLGALPAPQRRKGGHTSLQSLVNYAAEVARDKLAKDVGRRHIEVRIQLLLPLAAEEGRSSVLILGAARHALKAGGIRGRLWAPVTFAEYLRVTVEPLFTALEGRSIDAMDGAAFFTVYKAIVEGVLTSQRAKCSAFLQVFHRFLCIAGAEPLPAPLLADGPQLPPHAADFTTDEIRLALEYVECHAESTKIGLQARFILLAGFEIPFRTYEFWCIRLSDVDQNGGRWIAIYPRRLDGVGKVPGVRRTEDVTSVDARCVLLDLVHLRRHVEEAEDDDLLFGEALADRIRHEVVATERLVNRALRWASGVPTASIYDLRHACFQRQARAAGM